MATRCRSPTESFCRHVLQPMRKPNQAQQFFGLADSSAPVECPLEHGDLHVLERRQRRQQMKRLEDEADGPRAELVEIVAFRRGAAPRNRFRRATG